MRKDNSDERGLEDHDRLFFIDIIENGYPDLSVDERAAKIDKEVAKKIKPRTTEINEVLAKSQNPKSNVAAIFNDLDLFLHNYKKNLKDKFHFHKLDQKFVSCNKAVWLPHHHLIASTFKKKISLLIEGGFFNHWMDPYLSHRSVLEEEIVDDRIVLTMDHLSVGFTLWLGILFIATVAFVSEFCQINAPNFVRGLISESIIRAFFRHFNEI